MFSSSIVWAVGGMCVGVELGELLVLVEDVVELALEPRQLVLGQAESREVGDVLDVGAGQRGHAPMIRGRPPTRPQVAPTRDGSRLSARVACRPRARVEGGEVGGRVTGASTGVSTRRPGRAPP